MKAPTAASYPSILLKGETASPPAPKVTVKIEPSSQDLQSTVKLSPNSSHLPELCPTGNVFYCLLAHQPKNSTTKLAEQFIAPFDSVPTVELHPYYALENKVFKHPTLSLPNAQVQQPTPYTSPLSVTQTVQPPPSAQTQPPDSPATLSTNPLAHAFQQLLLKQDYKEILGLISSTTFAEEHKEEMRKVWLATIYLMKQANMKGRSTITPVSRYRARKAHPFPPSIQLENEEPVSYGYKESTRALLSTYFAEVNQYPSQHEKLALVRQTDLSYDQINTFFKNNRMRTKRCRRGS